MSLYNEDWQPGQAGTSRHGSEVPTARGQTPGFGHTPSVSGDTYGDTYGDNYGDSAGDGAGDGEAIVREEEEVFSAMALSTGLEEDELDDIRRLAKIWVRERGTPAILAWEGDVLDSLLNKVEQQNKMIATLREDPATSGEEHFRLVLVQTEMERAKFLVRSYVRTRLHKIEKYAQYITNTETLHPLLSGAELQHATRYAELLHAHFSSSVLDSLPEGFRRMDDKSMITEPNLDTPVLVYCRRDCGEITLERGEVAVLARGTTHLVRYNLVERWIQLGWAEVL